MVRPGTGTKYVTSVFYSGTPDAELDTFVGSVAKINRGKWSSSGCNHTSGARDICFSFAKEGPARAFGREVLSTKRRITTARVDEVRG